jgi:Lon protease-like protein
MQKNQRVADMAVEVLARQVGARVRRTGEPFEAALKAVLETEAGRQLAELRDGPHGDERAERWQEDLAHKRAQERKREQVEERQRAQEAAAWKLFMQEELRELEKRKSGQLAELLGEALPGEPSAALERLAYEDRRQAQDGLVALMSMGKVSYKHLDELSPKDMPARAAANRLRTTWLKERRDGWLARGLGGRT